MTKIERENEMIRHAHVNTLREMKLAFKYGTPAEKRLPFYASLYQHIHAYVESRTAK